MSTNDLSFSEADLAQSRHEASDRRLADRLDALETEKVLHRALELEYASTDATESFSPIDLERIAAEIGINPEFVRQAIVEVRAGGHGRSRLDSFLIPEQPVVQDTLADLSRSELNAFIRQWMTEYEGLIALAKINGGVEWAVDRSHLVRLRTVFMAGGNRMSISIPGTVAHRVATIREDEHIVTLSTSDRLPLLAAKLGAVFALLAGSLVGAVAMSLGIVVAVLAGTISALAVATAAILGARSWARTMRLAMRKALTGLMSRRVPEPSLPWKRRRRRR